MAYIQPYFTPSENRTAPWFTNVWNGFLKRREAENFRQMERFLKAQDLSYLDAQIQTSNENLKALYELRTELMKKDVEYAQTVAGHIVDLKKQSAEEDRLRDIALEGYKVDILKMEMGATSPMVVKLDQRRNQSEGWFNREPKFVADSAALLMGHGSKGRYLQSLDDADRALKAREIVIDPAIKRVYGEGMNSTKLMTENPAAYSMFVNSLMSHVEQYVADNTMKKHKMDGTSYDIDPRLHDGAYVKNALALADSIDLDLSTKTGVEKKFVEGLTDVDGKSYGRVSLPSKNIFVRYQLGAGTDVARADIYFNPNEDISKLGYSGFEMPEGTVLHSDAINKIKTIPGRQKLASRAAAKRFKTAAYAIQPNDPAAQRKVKNDMLAKVSSHERLGRIKKAIAIHQETHRKKPFKNMKFEGKDVDLYDLKQMKKDVSGTIYGRSLNPYKDKQLLLLWRKSSPILDEALSGGKGSQFQHKMRAQLQDDINDIRENIANLNIKRMQERKRIASGNLYKPFKRNFLLENPFKIKHQATEKGILVAKELEKIKAAPVAGDEVPDMPNVDYNQAYQTASGFAIGINKDKGAFIYDDAQSEYTYVNAKDEPAAYKRVMEGLRTQSKNPVLKPIFDLKKLSEQAQAEE